MANARAYHIGCFEVVESQSSEVKKILGFKNVKVSDDDTYVVKCFEETTTFDQGLYDVELPFKDNIDYIGDNYIVAKNRLKSLFNGTFKNNKELFIEYDKIIKEQNNLGILEHLDDIDQNKTPEVGAVYYMRHKPVVKEYKPSTHGF